MLLGRTRPVIAALVRSINEHRKVYGVEPICRALTEHGWQNAPSTYRARLPAAAFGAGPSLMKEQARRCVMLGQWPPPDCPAPAMN